MTDPSPLASLQRAMRALTDQERQVALVGGLAVSVRGEVRFTNDVDLAVGVADDSDAEQLMFALGQAGYQVVVTVEQERTGRLATARLRREGDVVLDLLLASSGIEAEIVQRATPVPLGPGFDVPVAQAEDLLTLKVLSASPERPQDAQDFVNLVRYNPDFDDAAVRRNLALIESRGCGRGQDLIAKYEGMLAGHR